MKILSIFPPVKYRTFDQPLGVRLRPLFYETVEQHSKVWLAIRGWS